MNGSRYSFPLITVTGGGAVNSWGSMLNRQYGNPNISKLLQLVNVKSFECQLVITYF